MDWSLIEPWLNSLLAATFAVVAALIAHRVLRFVVLRLTRFSTVLTAVVQACDRPAQIALPLLAVLLVWQASPTHLPGWDGVRHLSGVLFIIAMTWLAMRAARGVADGVIRLHPANVADNLQARRVHTQARVLSRTAQFILLMAGVSMVLMTFPGARQVGASLLASAGVVGLVAGIAAKSVFSNLIAGLQIALAQPIRIDDVLVVRGEWGRVEEITGTYVVLRIWDERRLIIPLQWLIENPFENWTRTGSEILGTVFLWVDYGIPVDPLREEARRLCEAAPEWDGRVCKVQVTDCNERAMQLRVLVSARSSGEAWDLRCKVREGLIEYVRRRHPQHLPRLRAEFAVTGDPLPAPEALVGRAVSPATR